ncbi:MAG: hypothetical protein ACREJQ_04595, partial [bacterium]
MDLLKEAAELLSASQLPPRKSEDAAFSRDKKGNLMAGNPDRQPDGIIFALDEKGVIDSPKIFEPEIHPGRKMKQLSICLFALILGLICISSTSNADQSAMEFSPIR